MIFDNSLRGSKYKSKNENFNYKKKLLEEKKINKDFLNRIKLLTIEEILYLKLDAAAASLSGKLLGFPILKFMPDICKEATTLFALSVTNSKREAAAILKVNIHQLNNLIKRYNINLKD